MGFNFSKATQPLRGDSLLFTTKSPVDPGTHLNDLEMMKVDFGVSFDFEPGTPWLGIQQTKH